MATNSREEMLNLLGATISLFDKSGDCIRPDGTAIVDWWTEPNTAIVTRVWDKYFFLKEMSGKETKLKLNKVLDITGNDVTLAVPC